MFLSKKFVAGRKHAAVQLANRVVRLSSGLGEFQEYKQALEFRAKKQYRLSNEYLQRVLQILDYSNMGKSELYEEVLRAGAEISLEGQLSAQSLEWHSLLHKHNRQKNLRSVFESPDGENYLILLVQNNIESVTD